MLFSQIVNPYHPILCFRCKNSHYLLIIKTHVDIIIYCCNIILHSYEDTSPQSKMCRVSWLSSENAQFTRCNGLQLGRDVFTCKLGEQKPTHSDKSPLYAFSPGGNKDRERAPLKRGEAEERMGEGIEKEGGRDRRTGIARPLILT